MTREAKNPVKATQRSFEVLRIVYELGSVRLTDVSAELGMSDSTAHNHLSTLVEAGFLSRESDFYHLSLRFLTYGEAARTRYKVSEAARFGLSDLTSELGEATSVVVAEDGYGYVVAHNRGTTDLQIDLFQGRRLPLHATSFGKVLLADLPDEDVVEIISQYGLVTCTAETITDRDQLFDELLSIRSQGYAICDEERLRGIRSIATAVRNERGVAVGAMGVTGPTSRLTDDRLQGQLLESLINAKNVVEL